MIKEVPVPVRTVTMEASQKQVTDQGHSKAVDATPWLVASRYDREASASKPMGFIVQPRPHLTQVQPLVYMLHLDTPFCRLSPRGRIRRVVTSEDWDCGKIDGDHGIFAGGAQKAV